MKKARTMIADNPPKNSGFFPHGKITVWLPIKAFIALALSITPAFAIQDATNVHAGTLAPTSIQVCWTSPFDSSVTGFFFDRDFGLVSDISNPGQGANVCATDFSPQAGGHFYSAKSHGPGGSPQGNPIGINITTPSGGTAIQITGSGSKDLGGNPGPNFPAGTGSVISFVVLNKAASNSCTITHNGTTYSAQVNGFTYFQQFGSIVAGTYNDAFSCTDNNPNTTVTQTITYTVAAPANVTINSFNGTTTITAGQSTNISWNTSNATSVSISGIGGVAANGSTTVSPTVTTVYTLTAQGSGGPISANVTITVNPAPVPLQLTSFASKDLSGNPGPNFPAGTGSVIPYVILNKTASSGCTISHLGTNYSAQVNGTTYFQQFGSIVAGTYNDAFSCTDNNPNTTVTQTITYTVAAPANVTINSFNGTTTITAGQSTNISWNTSNATSVSISGIGGVAANGSTTVSPTVTTVYTLTAQGSGGPISANVTITVNPAPVPLQLTSFASKDLSGNPGPNFPAGTGSVIPYVILNKTASSGCTISHLGTNYSAQVNGTTYFQQFGSIVAGTYNDAFSCTDNNPNTTVTQTITYTVAAPANVTINSFNGTTTITAGQSTNISWNTSNATSVSISPTIGNVAAIGSTSVSPTATTVYTLTAQGPGGPVTATVTITINSPLPTVTITATPSSIVAGQSTALSWTTTNATSASIDQSIGAVPATSGSSMQVSPTVDTTYTISVSGPGGSASNFVKVIVSPNNGFFSPGSGVYATSAATPFSVSLMNAQPSGNSISAIKQTDCAINNTSNEIVNVGGTSLNINLTDAPAGTTEFDVYGLNGGAPVPTGATAATCSTWYGPYYVGPLGANFNPTTVTAAQQSQPVLITLSPSRPLGRPAAPNNITGYYEWFGTGSPTISPTDTNGLCYGKYQSGNIGQAVGNPTAIDGMVTTAEQLSDFAGTYNDVYLAVCASDFSNPSMARVVAIQHYTLATPFVPTLTPFNPASTQFYGKDASGLNVNGTELDMGAGYTGAVPKLMWYQGTLGGFTLNATAVLDSGTKYKIGVPPQDGAWLLAVQAQSSVQTATFGGNPATVHYDGTKPIVCYRVYDHSAGASLPASQERFYQECPDLPAGAPNGNLISKICWTGGPQVVQNCPKPTFADAQGEDVYAFSYDPSPTDATDATDSRSSKVPPTTGFPNPPASGITAPPPPPTATFDNAPFNSFTQAWKYTPVTINGSYIFSGTSTDGAGNASGSIPTSFPFTLALTQPTVIIKSKNLDTGAATGWSCTYFGSGAPTCVGGTVGGNFPIFLDITTDMGSLPQPVLPALANTTTMGNAVVTPLSSPTGYEFELGSDLNTQPLDAALSTTLTYNFPAANATAGSAITSVTAFPISINLATFFPTNFGTDSTKATPTSIFYKWTKPTFAGTNFKLTQLGIYWGSSGPGTANTLIKNEMANATGTDLIDFSAIPGSGWQAGHVLQANTYMQATYSDGTHSMKFRTASPGDTSSTKTATPPVITVTVTPYDGSPAPSPSPCTTGTTGNASCLGGLTSPGELTVTVTGGTLSGTITGAGFVATNDYELATTQANNGTYSGTFTATDPVNGAATATVNYTASMAKLFATNPTFIYPGSDGDHLQVSWTAAASSLSNFPLQGYIVKYSGGQTNITTSNSVQLPLTNLSGWPAAKAAGLAFLVNLTIESQYTGKAPAVPYTYDTIGSYTVPARNGPTITYTAKSLATGNQSSVCTTPTSGAGCVQNLTGPITLSISATPGSGDTGISNLTPTVSGPGNPIGTGSGPINYKLVVANNSGPQYQVSASATGLNGVTQQTQPAFNYTLDFSGLYTTALNGTPQSASSAKVNYTWTNPGFTPGTGFQLVSLALKWNDSASGSSLGNPTLGPAITNLGTNAAGSSTVDFSVGPTASLWTAAQTSAQQLNTHVFIQSTWKDSANQQYVYDSPDFPLTIGSGANNAPTITVTIKDLDTGGVPQECSGNAALCICAGGPGTCQVSFAEPIKLNVTATSAPGAPGSLSLVSTVNGPIGLGPTTPIPGNLPQTGSTPSFDYSVVAGGGTSGTPLSYTVNATGVQSGASANFATSGATNFTLNLNNLYSTGLTGTEQPNFSPKVNFTWTNPNFAGTSGFKLTSLAIKWVGTIGAQGNPTLTPLAPITNLTKAFPNSATIDFSQGVTANLWTTAVAASQQLNIDVIVEAGFTSGGQTYYYDSTDFPLTIGSGASNTPSITVKITDLDTGGTPPECSGNAALCTCAGGPGTCQTTFGQPIKLNITGVAAPGGAGALSLVSTVNGPNGLGPATPPNGNLAQTGTMPSFNYNVVAGGGVSGTPLSYTVTGTATQSGASANFNTSGATNFTLNLNNIYPTALSGIEQPSFSPKVNFTWFNPNFVGASGFKLTSLTLKWVGTIGAQTNPALATLVPITNLTKSFPNSATVDFSNGVTAALWSASQSAATQLNIDVVLEAGFSFGGQTYLYDSADFPLAIGSGVNNAPTIAVKITSLANPGNPPAGCATLAACTCTAPGNCQLSFGEPVAMNITASPATTGGGTPSLTATVNGPSGAGPGAPSTINLTQTGTNPSFNYTLAAGGSASPLSYQVNASATLSGATGGFNTAGGTNFQINLGNLFAKGLNGLETGSSASVKYLWTNPTFAGGSGFTLKSISLRWIGSAGGQSNPTLTPTVAISNLTPGAANQATVNFSLGPTAALWATASAAGSQMPTDVVVESNWQDGAGNIYYYDSTDFVLSIGGAQPPTILATVTSLATGGTLSTCGVPSVSGCNTNFSEPVSLNITATAGAGDTSVSLNPTVTGPGSPTFTGAGANINYELAISNLTNPVYSVAASATGSPSTSQTVLPTANYQLNLNPLYVTAYTATVNSVSQITYNWAAPTFAGGPGFTFLKYVIKWDSSTNGAVTGNPTLATITNKATISAPIDFAANAFTSAAFAARLPAGGPFHTATIIESVWKDSNGTQFIYDSAVDQTQTTAAPQPTLSITAVKMADGVTVVSNCIQPAPATPPSPNCVTTFNEPVKLTFVATPGSAGDTISGFPAPTINPVPKPLGTYTFELASDNLQSVNYNVTSSAQGQQGGSVTNNQLYSLLQSNLFPTNYTGSATSVSNITYTWIVPTFAGGPNFQLKRLVIKWDSSSNGAVSGNPTLVTISNPTTAPTTTNIDFSANSFTSAAFAARVPAGSPFQTATFIEAVWQDNAGNTFVYDTPTSQVTTQSAGQPTVTMQAVSLANGTVLANCIKPSPTVAPSPACINSFNEPVKLTISGTAAPSDSISSFPAPTITSVPNIPPFSLGVNPYVYELVMSNALTPSYTVSATATGLAGGATSNSQPFSLNLNALFPTNYSGTATSVSNITFNWTIPTFAGGAGFSLQKLVIKWDSNTNGAVGGNPVLATILNPTTSPTTLNIDFSANSFTSGAFAARVPAGSPFQTATFIESVWKDTSGNTYTFDSPTAQETTQSAGQPTVTMQAVSLANGTVLANCIKPSPTVAPSPACINSFNEPVKLTISAAAAPSDSISSFAAPAITAIPNVAPFSLGSNPYVYELLMSNALTPSYNVTATAMGQAGGSTSNSQPFSLNLNALFPNNYSGTATSVSNITFNWTIPTFAGGAGFSLQKLVIKWDSNTNGAVGGNPVLATILNPTTSPTTLNIDFSANSFTSAAFASRVPAGSPFQTATFVEAVWKDTNGNNYVFDSQTSQDTTQSAGQPTVIFKAISLADGTVLANCIKPSPAISPSPACINSFNEPVQLTVSAAAAPSDSISGFPAPTITSIPNIAPFSLGSNPYIYELVMSNSLTPSYNVSATANGQAGGSTSNSQPFSLNLNTLFPTNYSGNATSVSNITFTWTIPSFAGGAGFTLQRLLIKWDSNTNGAVSGNPTLATILNPTTAPATLNIDFSANSFTSAAYASRIPAGSAFQTATFIEAVWKDTHGNTYIYDSPTSQDPTQSVGQPTVSIQAISLADGVTVLSNCIRPSPSTPPTPACISTFAEPVKMIFKATPGAGDTISSYPAPTFNQVPNIPPIPLALGANTYTYEVIMGNVLTPAYTIGSTAQGAAGGNTTNNQNYDFVLSSLFPDLYDGTATSVSNITFNWALPTFAGGPGLTLQKLVIKWDSNADGSVGGSPTLATILNPATGPTTMNLDFSAMPATQAAFLNRTPAGSPFQTATFIEAVWKDNKNNLFSYDYPTLQMATQPAPQPIITLLAIKMSDGVTVLSNCITPSPAVAPVPGCVSTLTEPVQLSISVAAAPTDSIKNFPSPVISATPNVPPITLAGGATSSTYSLTMSNFATPAYVVNANAQGMQGGTTSIVPQPYNLILNSLYATQYNGTAQTGSGSIINFTWTPPAFASTAKFTLQKLLIKWDSNANGVVSGNPTLANISPLTATTIPVDFAGSPQTQAAYQNRTPAGSPFHTSTFIESVWQDAFNNTYIYDTPTLALDTNIPPDHAPRSISVDNTLPASSAQYFTLKVQLATNPADNPPPAFVNATFQYDDETTGLPVNDAYTNSTPLAVVNGFLIVPVYPSKTNPGNTHYYNIQARVGTTGGTTDPSWSPLTPSALPSNTDAWTLPNAPTSGYQTASVFKTRITATIAFPSTPDNAKGTGYTIQMVKNIASFITPSITDPIRESNPVQFGQVPNAITALDPNTPYYIRTRAISNSTYQNLFDAYSAPGGSPVLTGGPVVNGKVLSQSSTSFNTSWDLSLFTNVAQLQIGATDYNAVPNGVSQVLNPPFVTPVVVAINNLTTANTSYTLYLQSMPITGTNWVIYDGSQFVGYTLAAQPGLPAPSFNGTSTGFGMTIGFNATPDSNSLDSRYILEVTPQGGQPGYLVGDGSFAATQSQALFRTLADWTSGKNHYDNLVLDSTYTIRIGVQEADPKVVPSVLWSPAATVITPHLAPQGPNPPSPVTNLRVLSTGATRLIWTWTPPATNLPTKLMLMDLATNLPIADVTTSNITGMTNTWMETGLSNAQSVGRYIACAVSLPSPSTSYSNVANATTLAQAGSFVLDPNVFTTGMMIDGQGYGIDVKGGNPVTVLFNGAIDPQSLSITNAIVLEQGTVASGGIKWNPLTLDANFYNQSFPNQITLMPQSGPFAPNQLYRVTFNNQISSLTGDPFGGTPVEFYTAPDATVDNVLSAVDANGLVTRFSIPANTFPQGGFPIVRNSFGPNTSSLSLPGLAPAQIINAASGIVPTATIRELMIYNAPSAPMTSFGNGNKVTVTIEYPAQVSSNASQRAAAADASGLSRVQAMTLVDPKTLTIFTIDPKTHRPMPTVGAALSSANNSVTAPVSGPGIYFVAAPLVTSLTNVVAYPVPFKPSAGHTSIKFNNLAVDSTIKIYTIMGELVAQLHNDNGEAILPWNVTNMDGNPVASGVYIYQIKNSFSEARGKLIIVR